jgi:hypothetical protein
LCLAPAIAAGSQKQEVDPEIAASRITSVAPTLEPVTLVY